MEEPKDYLKTFEREAANNIRRLSLEEVNPYFNRLESALNNFIAVAKQISIPDFEHSFLAPSIKNLQETLEILKLKHSMEGEDRVDFPPTVTTYECGFPTFKEFALLENDKEKAQQVITEIPKINSLLDTVKWKTLAGQVIEHEQILLRRRKYFSRLAEANIFPGLKMARAKPELKREVDGKRFYTIDWRGLQGGEGIPVFYRMWFSQDSRYPQLHDDSTTFGKLHPGLESFIQESRTAPYDLKTFVWKLNQSIDELHPKVIRRYTIGPFYDALTNNHPEIKTAFDDFENPFALKYKIEMVISVDITKTIFRNSWEYLKAVAKGKPMEKEVYSPTQIAASGLIVPIRVKQNLKMGCDEYGNPCQVYGVTNGGEVV